MEFGEPQTHLTQGETVCAITGIFLVVCIAHIDPHDRLNRSERQWLPLLLMRIFEAPLRQACLARGWKGCGWEWWGCLLSPRVRLSWTKPETFHP